MKNESNDIVLWVENRIDELTRVASFLDKLGEEWDLNDQHVFSLNLALEEALTNIILYGFEDEDKHTIEIKFKITKNELHLSVIDDGIAYDPTLKPDPDIRLTAEERPVGGLGIFLIKKLMDKVEYHRKENKNYLILTKNLKS